MFLVKYPKTQTISMWYYTLYHIWDNVPLDHMHIHHIMSNIEKKIMHESEACQKAPMLLMYELLANHVTPRFEMLNDFN